MRHGSNQQSKPHHVTIDLITENPDTTVFALVLVETGPWPSGTEERELRRIQERLYNCVDLAVDGHLAEKYPDSKGKPIRIQLDTYDIPEELVRPFFERFAKHVDTWPEVQQEIQTNQHVKSILFTYNPRRLESGNQRYM